MPVVQLLLDVVDGFDQVIPIAAGEGHARDGMLNGNQSLMYRGLLRPIHGDKFEPVWAKPQARKLKRPRLLAGGGALRSTDDCYFGAELEEELLLELLPFFLWCFFALLEEVEDELEGAEADEELDEGGVEWANAGPAMRAAARTGIRYLNIIAVVSEKIEVWCVGWEPERAYYAGNARGQVPYDRNVMLPADVRSGA